MIPILYASTETAFTSNGLGRLSDAISCKVVEKRNGSYELEMKYPADGIHFKDLSEDRLIFAKPFDGGYTDIALYNLTIDSMSFNYLLIVLLIHVHGRKFPSLR